MWVEFVVGSCPCSEGFSPGSRVFLPPEEATLPNSNSIWNSRATGLSVTRLLHATPFNKANLLIFYLVRQCFPFFKTVSLGEWFNQFASSFSCGM